MNFFLPAVLLIAVCVLLIFCIADYFNEKKTYDKLKKELSAEKKKRMKAKEKPPV